MEKKKDKTKIKDLVYCRDKVLREIASKKKIEGIKWKDKENSVRQLKIRRATNSKEVEETC